MQNVWGKRRGSYRVLVGKPEGRTPLGRPCLRGEDNIKMDFQEVERGGAGMDWIDLAQDRRRWRELLTTVKNLWGSIKCGEYLTMWEPVSFSRTTLLHGLWVCACAIHDLP